MSNHKFLNEQDSAAHGGILQWLHDRPDLPPIRSGKSFVGLTNDQVDDMDIHYDFKRKRFRLWEPKDLEEYCGIRDRAVNGNWYVVLRESPHWIEAEKDEVVILEWIQAYGDPHGSTRD